ncbi:MAG: 3'-5' exonuclease, partial [Candidatus Delongbacteria bacterium]|nr:3'-5' exonuclease [Candidatus Delongbacteria bacterium]
MKEKLKALKLSQFVVFDVETTGTDPQNDKVIEIAAIKYKDGEIFSQFSHLIDPGRKISEEISIITGIKNE